MFQNKMLYFYFERFQGGISLCSWWTHAAGGGRRRKRRQRGGDGEAESSRQSWTETMIAVWGAAEEKEKRPSHIYIPAGRDPSDICKAMEMSSWELDEWEEGRRTCDRNIGLQSSNFTGADKSEAEQEERKRSCCTAPFICFLIFTIHAIINQCFQSSIQMTSYQYQ